MSVIDVARTILRQQIGFARSHIDVVQQAESGFRKKSCLQAGLLCLEQGLGVYIGALLGQAGRVDLATLAVVLPDALQSQSQPDYRLEELLSLARDETSWLSSLCALSASMAVTASQWLGGEGQGASGANIIATSASREKVRIHWSELDFPAFNVVLKGVESLLDRHIEHDQEY